MTPAIVALLGTTARVVCRGCLALTPYDPDRADDPRCATCRGDEPRCEECHEPCGATARGGLCLACRTRAYAEIFAEAA